MEDVSNYQMEITTGQFHAATLEQQKMLRQLFGKNAEYHFEIYFHWYNLIHEVGHAVFEFNSLKRPHPVDEEQLVNNFAIAYWRHYGEWEKVKVLTKIVDETIRKFIVPVQDTDYITYAKQAWGKEELNNFNNYGWFQFNCVKNSLLLEQSLEESIINMRVSNIQPQEKKIFRYNVDQLMPLQVVEDGTKELRNWGIALPKVVSVKYSNDPNCHMCQCKAI